MELLSAVAARASRAYAEIDSEQWSLERVLVAPDRSGFSDVAHRQALQFNERLGSKLTLLQ